MVRKSSPGACVVVIFTAANICRGGKGNIVRVLTETVQQGTRLEMEEELDTAAVKL